MAAFEGAASVYLPPHVLTHILSSFLQEPSRRQSITPGECGVCGERHISPFVVSSYVSPELTRVALSAPLLKNAASVALSRLRKNMNLMALLVWLEEHKNEYSMIDIIAWLRLCAPLIKRLSWCSCYMHGVSNLVMDLDNTFASPKLSAFLMQIADIRFHALKELDLEGICFSAKHKSTDCEEELRFHRMDSDDDLTSDDDAVSDEQIITFFAALSRNLRKLCIRPSSRLLRVIREINFDALRCLVIGSRCNIEDMRLYSILPALGRCAFSNLETLIFADELYIPGPIGEPLFSKLVESITTLQFSWRPGYQVAVFEDFIGNFVSIRKLVWNGCCCAKCACTVLRVCKNLKELEFYPTSCHEIDELFLLNSINPIYLDPKFIAEGDNDPEEYDTKHFRSLCVFLSVLGSVVTTLDITMSPNILNIPWVWRTSRQLAILPDLCPGLKELTIIADQKSMKGLVKLCEKLSGSLFKLFIQYAYERGNNVMTKESWSQLSEAVSRAHQLSHFRFDSSPRNKPRGGSFVDIMNTLEECLRHMGIRCRYLWFSVASHDVQFAEDIVEAHTRAMSALKEHCTHLEKFSFSTGVYKQEYKWKSSCTQSCSKSKMHRYVRAVDRVARELQSLQSIGFSGVLAEKFSNMMAEGKWLGELTPTEKCRF